MKFRTYIKMLFVSMALVCMMLAGCHDAPKTDMERIADLKQQVKDDALRLKDLETKDFPKLEKDFKTCDSLLQFMTREQMDEAFEKLNLVQAYLLQFKEMQPLMKAQADSTLLQLDRLKADAESHYLTDSLVSVYLADETEIVNTLGNQIEYFQDRFGTCQKDLTTLKKKH